MFKNNKLFEMLFDHSLDGIYLLQNFGELVYVNPSFCNMLGYTEDDLVGKKLLDFIHPHDYKLVDKNIKKRQAGISFSEHFEFRCITSHGDIIFIEAKGTRVEDFNGSPAIIETVKDISEQRKYNKQLQIFLRLFQCHTNAILISDHRNHIIDVNHAFEHITGYSKQEMIGKNPKVLSSGRHNDGFYKKLWAELSQNNFWQGEIWDKRKDGSVYPKWISIFVIKDDRNVIQNFVAEFQDISYQKQFEDNSKQLRFYDTLTSLPNRILLVEKLNELMSSHKYFPVDIEKSLSFFRQDNSLPISDTEEFIERSLYEKTIQKYSENNQNQIAILFLNLDRFKNINDTLGHATGDQVIKEVARRLEEYIAIGNYLLARIGNDEFIIVKPNTTRVEITKEIRILIKRISMPYILIGQAIPINISTSIGISMYPEDDQDSEGLIKKSHIAMFQSKYAGRKTFCFFSGDLYEKYTERMYLEHHLSEALKTRNSLIEESQLVLYYQPKVHLKTNKIVGVEALIRWKHPVMGFISPAKFIPSAEECGLILDLSEWVIREACLQFNKWIRQGLPPIQIAVNISGAHFLQESFTIRLSRIIAETEMNPNFLELEITEGIFLNSDKIDIIKQFELLHYLGLKLSLDDFGTGYSALNYLHQFPIDYLKIDQSFIRQMTKNPSMLVIVESITKLARRLGLQVIAEGVEYTEELDILKQHECDQVQGFYFSPALPPDEFLKFYNQFNRNNQDKEIQNFDPQI